MVRDGYGRCRLRDGCHHASSAMNDKVTGPQETPAVPERGITPHPTGSQDNRITDSPDLAPAPQPAVRSSRRVQWVVAAVVLAVMVFVITFAMNYLGGPPSGGQSVRSSNPEMDRTLHF